MSDTDKNQRMRDLVRFARHFLHTEELITDTEYGEICQDHSAVARLEDYDALRVQLQQLQSRQAKLLEAAIYFQRGYSGWCCVPAGIIDPSEHDENCPAKKHASVIHEARAAAAIAEDGK